VNDYNDVLRQDQSQPPTTLRERRRAKRTQLPVLRHLTSLTIHHIHSYDLVRDRNVFCSFARRLIAHSKLRSLVLSRQHLSGSDSILSDSYNALLAHLCAKHGSWLEVMDAPYFYLGRTAFTDLVPAVMRSFVHETCKYWLTWVLIFTNYRSACNRDHLFGASAGLGTCRQGKEAPHHVGRSKLLLTADFLCFGLFYATLPYTPP
jgi:hypothetical protein